MNILAEDSTLKYYLIEEASEVDNFEIADFDFFKLYGIENYRETFKVWLRRFPRPVFITGVIKDEIVSFIYIDAWEELPEVINVLRAQETYKKLRGKKIGYKIFLLGLFLTSGYILTKPLTNKSAEFYKSLGFIKTYDASPIFSRFHTLTGYLALPVEKRDKHISKIEEYFIKLYL